MQCRPAQQPWLLGHCGLDAAQHRVSSALQWGGEAWGLACAPVASCGLSHCSAGQAHGLRGEERVPETDEALPDSCLLVRAGQLDVHCV